MSLFTGKWPFFTDCMLLREQVMNDKEDQPPALQSAPNVHNETWGGTPILNME